MKEKKLLKIKDTNLKQKILINTNKVQGNKPVKHLKPKI
jgi:hypothetical protein